MATSTFTQVDFLTILYNFAPRYIRYIRTSSRVDLYTKDYNNFVTPDRGSVQWMIHWPGVDSGENHLSQLRFGVYSSTFEPVARLFRGERRSHCCERRFPRFTWVAVLIRGTGAASSQLPLQRSHCSILRNYFRFEHAIANQRSVIPQSSKLAGIGAKSQQ